MAKQRQDKQPVEEENQESPQVNAAIAEKVIQALGHPGNLQLVQVRTLWRDHYRVNVLVGSDPTTIRIAHSYFLVADSQGSILTSTPSITRRY